MDLGTLNWSVEVDTSDLSRAEREMDGMGSESEVAQRRVTTATERMNNGLNGLAKTAALATAALASIGVGMGVSNAVREIANFQEAMNGLAAVSGATAAQMKTLEAQARTLGATSMFSAQQAGEAQRFLAQAGLEVNEVLGATPGILKLATAGQLDLASAADIASNVLGGMRLEVDQLNRVNDVLAATAAGANTDIQQLGQALSFAAPFAASAGISIEQASAAIGVMSDAGIQASRAGTGLVGVIRQLSNITPNAAGALAELGLSAADVNIETHGLEAVLDTLSGTSMNTAQAITIFGSEAGAAAQVLVNASGRVSEFTGNLNDSEGAVDRMALILGQGLNPAFKALGSAISEATLQLGDTGLASNLESLVGIAAGVVSVYNGLLDEFADANDLTAEQSQRLQSLAGMINNAATAVTALAAIYATNLVTSIGAATIANVKNTVALNANLKAGAAAAAATVRRTAAERQAAFALLSTTKLEVAATRGTNAHAFALQQLSVARTRAATAAGAHTAAMNTATAAAARASVAARGLSTALALVGGPIGLMIGAGGLLYVFRDELNLTGHRAGLTEDQIADLRDEMQEMSQEDLSQSLSSLNTALDAATVKAATAREELARLRSENRGSGVLGVDNFGAEVRGMQAVAEAQERIVELNQKINVARGETAQRIEDNANAFVVYADRLERTREETALADEVTKTLNDTAETSAGNFGNLSDSLNTLLNRLDPARARTQAYAQGVGLLNTALATGTLNFGDYQRAMVALQEELYNVEEATDTATDEMVKVWEQRMERMDAAGVETWRSFLTGAEDVFGSFKRLAINTLAEVIHAYTTQKITASLGFNLSGGMVGSQGGGLGGIGSLVNGAKSLFGFGGSAAAPSLAMQGGLSSVALASASQVANGAAYGGWAGSAASGAALGNAAGGGLMSSITSGISAAMPWLAGGALIDNVLGLGIVDGIVGAVSSLFGGGKTAPKFELATVNADTPGHGVFEDYGSGVVARGAFGAVGFTDQGTARLEESFGGFENATAFLNQITAMDNALASVAGSEQELNAMADAVQAVRLNANDAAGIQDQLAKRTAAAANVIDAEFTQSLVDAGATAEEITLRFVNADAAMQTLSAVAERLNLQWNAGADGALRYADAIANQVGGVQQMAALQESYYQQFFTDAERTANLQDDLTKSLAAMGAELPQSRDGFRALVEAQDLSTEAGQRNFATLLQLAGSFDQLQTSMQNTSVAADSLSSELDLSGVKRAWDAFSRSIDAEQEILKRAYDAQRGSIQSNIRTIQNGIRDTESMAQRFSSALGQMASNELAINQSARFASGQAYLQSVLVGGGLGDPAAIESALAAVANPSEATYETLEDYQRDFLATAGVISQLNERAEGQLTTEDRSLRALERQLENAERGYQLEMQALEQDREQQAETLEAIFGTQDWLSTVNDSVLSLADAIASLKSASVSAGGFPSTGGPTETRAGNVAEGYDAEGDPLLSGATGAIADAYREILGRDPDDTGLAFYEISGRSAEQIRRELAASPEGERYQNSGIPGFANGGAHAGGWRIVGERGAELEYKGKSRIMSNSDTRAMMDNSQVKESVDQMNQNLEAVLRGILEASQETASIMDDWDTLGQPGERNITA